MPAALLGRREGEKGSQMASDCAWAGAAFLPLIAHFSGSLLAPDSCSQVQWNRGGCLSWGKLLASLLLSLWLLPTIGGGTGF